LWTDWDKIVIVRSRRDYRYLEMIKCWVSNSAEKGSVQRGEIFGWRFCMGFVATEPPNSAW